MCVVLITSMYTDPNAFQINYTLSPTFKSRTLMNGEIENPHIDVIFCQRDIVIVFLPIINRAVLLKK